jgi:hypothetical protein
MRFDPNKIGVKKLRGASENLFKDLDIYPKAPYSNVQTTNI